MHIMLKPEDEAFIAQQLAQGRFQTATDIVHEALRLLETREHIALTNSTESAGVEQEAKSIWEIFDEIMSDAPKEELKKLPMDAAEQHDHYLYGAPKKTC